MLGAVVGVASGTIVVLIAIIVFLIYRQRRRKRQDKSGPILRDTEEPWSKPELPGQSAVKEEVTRISAVEFEVRRAALAELETVERSQELPI